MPAIELVQDDAEVQSRIIRPPRWRRTPAMIKGRLTRALVSIGMAGGLLLGTAAVAGAGGLCPQFGGIKETNRNDMLQASGKSFVGPVDDAFFVDLGATFDGISR